MFNVQVGYKTADVVTSGAHLYLDEEHWQVLRERPTAAHRRGLRAHGGFLVFRRTAMHCTVAPRYPCPDAPHEGCRMLAVAVLVELVADFQGSSPKRRAEARRAVHDGAVSFGLDVLALTKPQRQRVLALLAG